MVTVYEALALVEREDLGLLLLGKQRQISFLLTLSPPASLHLPSAKDQRFLWVEHLLPAEDFIAVTCTGLPNPPWPGLVLFPHDISGWGRGQGCPWPHQH